MCKLSHICYDKTNVFSCTYASCNTTKAYYYILLNTYNHSMYVCVILGVSINNDDHLVYKNL